MKNTSFLGVSSKKPGNTFILINQMQAHSFHLCMWCRLSSDHSQLHETHNRSIYDVFGASPVAHLVQNLPPMQKNEILSLVQEGRLEKGMATPSSFLTWRIPWIKETAGIQSMGSCRIGHDLVTEEQQIYAYVFFRWIRIQNSSGVGPINLVVSLSGFNITLMLAAWNGLYCMFIRIYSFLINY